MSLYNMLHGENPLADILLAMLGLSRADVGRYRDCYLAEPQDGRAPEIHVYTRNGGGNRESYGDVFAALAEHSGYLWDRDDDFDCTYATIAFSVPEHARAGLEGMATKTTPADKWDSLLDGLRAGDTSDPKVAAALKVGEEILGQVVAAVADDTGDSEP